MLIFKKYSIKISILSGLFILGGLQLFAVNPIFNGVERTKYLLTAEKHGNATTESTTFDLLALLNQQNDTGKIAQITNDIVIPKDLLNSTFNFQINSAISYYHLKHFVYPESKRLFIHSWLKEKELQKLTNYTDSLRKSYSTASDEEREKISALILQLEEKSFALNGEIPTDFEKAREEENRYWQTASLDEVTNFQQKIRVYQDSLAQSRQILAEVPDTIVMFEPHTIEKTEDKKVEVPSGIVYKIQIGAFKGKIPDANNKLIKKLSIIRKVENQVDEKGVKVYTTGNLRTYAEAEMLLSQVKQEGVKNATIVAYQNGKKTNIADARKLNK